MNNCNINVNDEPRNKLLAIFKNVEKPARYIGGEINSIVKNSSDVKVAMCFPDLYEIGISNLGMSILYEAINNTEYASCERLYSVGRDFEDALRDNDIPLYTLETLNPVRNFDVLGFTLQYELLYTNILQVLDLSNIAIDRTQRAEDEPIVIAGGPCVYNPLPLSNYIDVFFMGEYDDKIVEIVGVVNEGKKQNKSRSEIIQMLSTLSYAYSFEYPKDRVVRHFIDDLDNAVYPKKPIVPISEGIQNRLTIEIARGCTHGCRFCAAGNIYRPVRNRSFAKIIEIVDCSLKATGGNEINLASLSSDDYPNIKYLIKYLQQKGEDEGFSISLPSLHVDSFSSDSIIPISEFKKTGLTFALESGSDEIRKKINKVMNADAIFDIIKDIKSIGYKVVKLYFMIGLTDRAEVEKDAIIEVLDKISSLAGKSIRVNAAINVFVPKPHTSLQHIRQLSDNEAMKYIMEIRTYRYHYKNIFVKFNPPRMSVVEGILSRGGVEANEIILNAYKLGCRLDAWVEHFDYDKWTRAVELAGYSFEHFLKGSRREEQKPWNFIDIGIKDSYLEKEYQNYENATTVDDCRYSNCSGCGIDYKKYCDKNMKQNDISRYEVPKYIKHNNNRNIYETEYKLFARFQKLGISAVLGHFDLRRIILSALKIMGIKITMTQGFHPLPKVVFSEPISFGVESECEYFEISCYEKPNIENMPSFIKKVNDILPSGIDIASMEVLEKVMKKMQTLPKDSLYRLSTTDNTLAYNLLLDKEAFKNISGRLGDYNIIKDDNYIYINILFSDNKIIRYKDINNLLSDNNIQIKNALKMFN